MEVFKPQNLERDSIEQFKKAKKDRDVKKHLRQRELYPEKFEKPKYGQNWKCLSKLEYPASEQREITKMIGLKYDPLPVKGKEGKGGGGQAIHRKQKTLENVGSSQAFKDIQMTLDFGLNLDKKPIKKINYLRQSQSIESSLDKSSFLKRDKNTFYMKSSSRLISPRDNQGSFDQNKNFIRNKEFNKNQSSPDYTDYQFQVPNIKVKKSHSIPLQSNEQISVSSTNVQSVGNQSLTNLQNQIQSLKADSSYSLSRFKQPGTQTTFKRGYNPSKFSISGQFSIKDPDLAYQRKKALMMMKNSESMERVKRMNQQQELRKQDKIYWESRNKSITHLSAINFISDVSSNSPFSIYGVETKESSTSKVKKDLSNLSNVDLPRQDRLSQDVISLAKQKHHSFYSNTFNQRY